MLRSILASWQHDGDVEAENGRFLATLLREGGLGEELAWTKQVIDTDCEVLRLRAFRSPGTRYADFAAFIQDLHGRGSVGGGFVGAHGEGLQTPEHAGKDRVEAIGELAAAIRT